MMVTAFLELPEPLKKQKKRPQVAHPHSILWFGLPHAGSAVAILRRPSHCDETARFLPPPPLFLAVHHTPLLTFWTRGTYYYVMEIDAVPRRTYYYVLDLHGFNDPALVSVVHDWTPTWTRGLAMSHCAFRRKKIVHCTWEAGVLNACVFSDFQRYCTKGARLHASFAWRTSSKHILQTMEAVLSIFWMTSVIFGQVFRRN